MSVLQASTGIVGSDELPLLRARALAAVRVAQADLERLQAADSPCWHDVEAADHLDTAADLLARSLPA